MPRATSAADQLLFKFDAVTCSIGHAEGSMSRGDKSKVYEALRECRSNLHVLREHVLKLNAELSDAHERGYQLGLSDGRQSKQE